MSKRRLENDIDELYDEVLSDLTPDEQLQFLLKARAKEKEAWIDRLIETCPRYNYHGPDQSVVVRAQLAQQLAYHAVYDLYTTYLHYQLVRTKQDYSMALDYERDEEPSDEELNRAADRANEVREFFAGLYIAYHAYRQFAAEVLGVAPETWLALHPDGLAVFEAGAEALDNPSESRRAESYLREKLDEQDETIELSETERDDNQAVALKYKSDVICGKLVTVWEEATAEILYR